MKTNVSANIMDKPQLFLLHYAGGNALSYTFLHPYLKDAFEIVALELPGRGKRINEQLVTDFATAVSDYFSQIVQWLRTNEFYIFGHSMGAYLTLAVTRKLEENGLFPTHLIVSGNAGPGIYADEKRYLLDKYEFLTQLQALGGIPSEILDNKEFLEFYLPVIRADFEVIEKEDDLDISSVMAPIYAVMGDKEKNCDKILNWKRCSNTSFHYRILTGGHFFIQKHPLLLAELIKSLLLVEGRLVYQ